MNEEEINHYKTIVGAYYGVMLMDEYSLKAYVLKKLENLGKNYCQNKNMNSEEIKSFVAQKVSKKVKLQDALYILNQLDEDKELLHLIKRKIREIDSEEN
mgnify:CR=1 FL=1